MSLVYGDPYLLPSPSSVFTTLVELVRDHTLAIALIASTKRIIVGYLISILLGIVIGLTIVRFKGLDENVSALILGLQTLPSICWPPLAILWYGLNESAIIFVLAVGSTFAIAIESGVKNVNPLSLSEQRTPWGRTALKCTGMRSSLQVCPV